MKILSPGQKKIIDFIESCYKKTGHAPTVDEVAKGCNIEPRLAQYNLDVVELQKLWEAERAKPPAAPAAPTKPA